MKNLSILIVALILLASCKNQISIQGEIENMPAQKIVLEEMTVGNPIFIDSVTTDEKGQFTLKLKPTSEKLYRLSFIEKKYILLSLQQGDVAKIKADWNSIENYTVTGSKHSETMKAFVLGTRENIITLNTMQMIVDTLKKTGASDSMQKASVDALARENTNFMQFLKKFTDTTTSSSVALMAVNMMNPKFETPFITNFYQQVDKRFPKSELAKAYRDRFSEAVNADTEPLQTNQGTPAPDFEAKNTDDKLVKLSDFRGKFVLLDFWASWCAPCRAENPSVVKAYEAFKSKNFTVIGFSLDTDKNNWKEAIKKDGLTWPQMSELGGWGSKTAALYQVNSIPMNFLIDTNGNIVAKNLRGEDLMKTLEQILK